MQRIPLILILLCSIHFWGYNRIPQSIFNITDLLSLLVLGYSLINSFQEQGLRFRNAIVLLIFGIICNILSAYFNNGQNPKDTGLSFGPTYFILFYFYLHESKASRKEMENIILVFAILYAVFYLYQYTVYPRRIFAGSMFEDRGTIRIKIEGSGFLMLAYFMLLNKYLLKRNIIQMILALFFFVILLKGGFRTLTAAGIFLTGFIFLRMVKYSPTNYFLIVLAVIMFLGMLQMESTSTIITGMLDTTKEQQEQGDQYIRKVARRYYIHEYPQNFSYYIFGGGLPGAYGSYSNRMGFMALQYGFYWVDLGLLGFYLVIGLIALLGLLWFALWATFIKLPPDCLYLNIYFAFLLIVSYTTMEIYRPGIMPIEAIGLYLIDLARNEKLGIKIKTSIEAQELFTGKAYM